MLEGVGDPFASWTDVTYVGNIVDENGTGQCGLNHRLVACAGSLEASTPLCDTTLVAFVCGQCESSNVMLVFRGAAAPPVRGSSMQAPIHSKV